MASVVVVAAAAAAALVVIADDVVAGGEDAGVEDVFVDEEEFEMLRGTVGLDAMLIMV